jgi:hypothetical protein
LLNFLSRGSTARRSIALTGSAMASVTMPSKVSDTRDAAEALTDASFHRLPLQA